MKAVILAGGLGTRLRPLTYHVPKPLIPIAGKPMVEHILDALPPEVDRVALAVSYKADQVRERFTDHTYRFTVEILEEPEPLGTGGAIRNAVGDGEEALVFNGDILSSLDVGRFVADHEAAGGQGRIALWEVEDPSRFGVVVTEGHDGSGRVREFLEKPEEPPSRRVNAGVYLLGPEVVALIPRGRPVSVERETFPLAIGRGLDLFGHPFSGYWVDAGTPDSYLRAQSALQGGRPWIDPGSVLGEGAAVEGASAVYGGAEIGRRARVADSAVLPGATVGEGAVLERSIVGWGVHVPAGSHLTGAVLALPAGR